MSRWSRPSLGRIVNRVCLACGAEMVVGENWTEGENAHECLICSETFCDEDGVPFDQAHTLPLPEDVRIRLASGYTYRRRPRPRFNA